MKNNIKITQQCKNRNCKKEYEINKFIFECPECGSILEYKIEGKYTGPQNEREDLWNFFDLIPLSDKKNIISLDTGGSKILKLEELSELVNGANVYIMLDSHKNPTGTFKDREASIIISKCKEQKLDDLVFYSTANTGRAYTHFASEIGLTSYMFMPKQCQYKNTASIKKGENNKIILVDDNYQEISPFVKKFSRDNNLNAIAPMHDRIEAYATIAYEQFYKFPTCNYYVQTIASGMGAIGFYKGHENLVKLGLQKDENIPKIICIQSSEMNVMANAYNKGQKIITKEDMPKEFRKDLYEPTLNSTNPVNNYPDFLHTLNKNNGIIEDVTPDFVELEGKKIVKALKKYGLGLRDDLEKSVLIQFAGLIKLAQKGYFQKGENILMLSTGREEEIVNNYLEPDAEINPHKVDTKSLFSKLKKSN